MSMPGIPFGFCPAGRGVRPAFALKVGAEITQIDHFGFVILLCHYSGKRVSIVRVVIAIRRRFVQLQQLPPFGVTSNGQQHHHSTRHPTLDSRKEQEFNVSLRQRDIEFLMFCPPFCTALSGGLHKLMLCR